MAAPSTVWRRFSNPGLSLNEMILYQFETKRSLIAQLGHPTDGDCSVDFLACDLRSDSTNPQKEKGVSQQILTD